ncbi:MAG: hypothetical protein HYT03_02515 [Candidatus Harrisonbacteria bacterium]|nr:hypothetical protein [Candidatus Harrisonbacteria bacterium]
MIRHKSLAAGGWQKLSLAEQLGNIGSEIGRAKRWQEKDQKLFHEAVDRSLELFDLTLEDPRWKGRRREIEIAREVFCEIIFGENKYHSSLPDLLRYFDQFAYAARLRV